MNTEFMQNLYNQGYFSIEEGFDSWEDALHACVEPLVRNGAVDPGYGDSIVNAVHEFGPYICIAPGICMPHALNTGEVRKTAISFMKSNRPVEFDEDEDNHSLLFFTLASNDSETHLKNMKELMKTLEQDDLMEAMMECRTDGDFRRLLFGE